MGKHHFIQVQENTAFHAVLSAVQERGIPAVHAADVQLSEQSLDVAASDWSQSKSARRKQKRRGDAKHLNPLDADSAAASPAQKHAAAQNASSTQDARDSSQSQTTAVAVSANAAVPEGTSASPKQPGTVLMPRVASPLGKNGLGGFRSQAAKQAPTGGSQGFQARPAQQDQWAAVQPFARQLDTQEDTDALIMVRL